MTSVWYTVALRAQNSWEDTTLNMASTICRYLEQVPENNRIIEFASISHAKLK